MKARIDSPALTLPGALDALTALSKTAAEHGELPRQLVELINLRVSQINGCAVCLDMHSRALRKLGEPDERIYAVAAWREAPYYSEAERAALALSEAATRLADCPNPVPDDVWNEAARHYSPQALASLVMTIGLINLWNRLNCSIKQPSGPWTARYV
jgi:AhpD family alkylhydroperoxidase